MSMSLGSSPGSPVDQRRKSFGDDNRSSSPTTPRHLKMSTDRLATWSPSDRIAAAATLATPIVEFPSEGFSKSSHYGTALSLHCELPEEHRVIQRFGPRLLPFLQNVAQEMLSPAMADIVLSADGVDFPCHFFVLACATEYFARLQRGENKDAAASFERRHNGEQPRFRLNLLGKTRSAVEGLLRILYFKATTHEVLSEDGRKIIEIYLLAKEWEVTDVVKQVAEFVRDDVHDRETLVFLINGLGYDEEAQELRAICEYRVRRLTEEETLRTEDVRRDGACVADFAGLSRSPDAPARWATTAQSGRRIDHWSSPTNFPRILGR